MVGILPYSKEVTNSNLIRYYQLPIRPASHSVAQSSSSAVQYYQSPSFTCRPCFPTVCLYQKDANNSFQIQIQYLRRPKGKISKSEENQPTLPKKPKVFTKAPRDRGLCYCYYQGLGDLEFGRDLAVFKRSNKFKPNSILPITNSARFPFSRSIFQFSSPILPIAVFHLQALFSHRMFVSERRQ